MRLSVRENKREEGKISLERYKFLFAECILTSLTHKSYARIEGPRNRKWNIVNYE